MTKKSTSRKYSSNAPREKKSPAEINRRKEWRLELPLSAEVEGQLPQGKSFKEKTTLENISSEGAYFGLDSKITIDSKLSLLIELPSHLSEGKKIQLYLGGHAVRLEKLCKKQKNQGIALKFDKEFKGDELKIVPKK